MAARGAGGIAGGFIRRFGCSAAAARICVCVSVSFIVGAPGQHPVSRVLPARALQAKACQGSAKPSPARHDASLCSGLEPSEICSAASGSAQIAITGIDGPIELEALRLYGLREDAPASLCGNPSLPAGTRTLALETSWDLPNLAPGETSLLDVTVNGARQGDLAHAALASSTRFIELDAAAWSSNTVRVMARNISPTATFDLGAATLSVQVTKRRVQ